MAQVSLSTDQELANPSFRQLFADRRLMGLSAAAAIGRWQDSMMVLALIVTGHSLGFSLTEISIAVSALTITAGLSASFKGRLQDRFGVRRLVGSLSIMSAFGYTLLILALLSHSLILVISAAILLGLMRTNPGAYMQITWAQILDDQELQAKSSSWESLVTTIMQNTGPLLVSALIALLMPMAALIFCGIATSISMWAWSRSSLHRQNDTRAKRDGQSKASSRINSNVIKVAAVVMMTSILAGALQVVLVGDNNESLAAILNAIFAIGASLASVYSLARKMPFANNLNKAMIGGLAVLTPVIAIAANTGPWIIVPALIIGGIFYNMSNTASQLLIKQHAPKNRIAEAFSWRVTFNFVGISLGQLIAGLLIGAVGVAGAGLIIAGLGFVFFIGSRLLLSDGKVKPVSSSQPLPSYRRSLRLKMA